MLAAAAISAGIMIAGRAVAAPESAPQSGLELADPKGRAPAELLASAFQTRDANRTAEAVVLAYLSLQRATPGEPLTLDERSRAHLLLSELHGELGYYAAERVHGKQASNLYAERQPPDTATQGRLLKRLGDLAARINDFEVARFHYEEAASQFEKTGTETVAEIEVHLALARLAMSQAKLQYILDSDALQILQSAHEPIDRASHLLETVDVEVQAAGWLSVLQIQAELLLSISGNLERADTSLAQSTLQEAENLLGLALSEMRRRPRHQAEDEVVVLNGLIAVTRRTGRFVEALNYVDEAMVISEERQRADRHTNFNMALVAAHFENTSPLENICRILARQEKAVFDSLSEASSEAVAIAYGERGRFHSAVCLALLAELEATPARARQMADIMLMRKAIIAEAESRFWQTVHRASDAALAEWRRQLLRLRQDLSVRAAARDATQLWRLTEQIEALEAHLGVGVQYSSLLNDPSMTEARRSLSTYGQSLLEGEMPWDAVVSLEHDFDEPEADSESILRDLPDDTVLVDFVRIESFDLEREIFSGAATYWAFLLSPLGTVDAVRLGDADTLDRQIFEALETLNSGDRLVPTRQLLAMGRLFEAIWQPLAGLVGSAERVVVSPEGALALVPFAALLDADTNRFLIEDKTIYLAASGRFGPTVRSGEPGPPLVVGAPAFDHRALKGQNGALPHPLVPLKGTRTEAQTVFEKLGAEGFLLTDDQASESELRKIRRPRVLHIASHGLFLADRDPLLPETVPLQDRVAAQAAYARHVQTLSRSGLALAGANTGGFGDGDDGFLTAFDAASLDLSGTDLVVLSGCETGLGSLQDSEGVLGLRRSFRIAGAKHVLMSLWRLPDLEAVRQMRVFYDLYLQYADPVAALRDVQRKRIEWYRNALEETPPPAIWAAFTIGGALPSRSR